MKKLRGSFCLLLVLFAPLAWAQKGKFTTYTTNWNGLKRTYSVYVPQVLQRTPALVIALHGTIIGPQSQPPLTACTTGMGWDTIADASGFVLLCPISSYRQAEGTIPGQFFWESYGLDNYFPLPPDDSGFLRSLILKLELPTVQGGYNIDPNRVFVMGFSSGGMMTHRACIENADLVAACAPMSGTLWVVNPSLQIPQPVRPVSIMELHGDQDPHILYCGGLFLGWNDTWILAPSVDVDVNYWQAADNLPSNLMPLCHEGKVAGNVFGVDLRAPDSNIEVQFVREVGFGHTYYQWSVATVWEFLSTHGR